MGAVLPMTLLFLSAAPSADGAYVVEARMEPVIRALALVPPGAPSGTRPGGAALSPDHVLIRYGLADGTEATFTLRHPEAAKESAVVAGPFAITSSLPADHALHRAFTQAAKGLVGRFHWRLVGDGHGAKGASPLAEARARLLMVDQDGVRGAVARAVRATPGDPSVLRDGAVLLRAAGLDEASQELARRAEETIQRPGAASHPEHGTDRLVLRFLAAADADGRKAAWTAHAAPASCVLTPAADALLLLGLPEEALGAVDAILAEAPSCRDAHRLGCEIAGRQHQWARLLARVEAAELHLPGDPDFRVRRATALRGLGRYDEARDLLEQVVRTRPRGGAMSSLANLYTMTRADEASFQGLQGRCAAKPSDVVSCFLAGVIAHYLAHHEACVSQMAALLERLPEQPRVPMYAAISSFYLGRVEDADRFIDQAAAISGAMDPDVYYCRSLIRRGRDLPGAIADLERFLEVARFGWHSEGKIERVTHELAQLRLGIIPPPGEAHHRAEDAPIPDGAAAGGAGQVATDPGAEAEGKPSPSPEETDEPLPVVWLVILATVGALLARAGLARRRRSDGP